MKRLKTITFSVCMVLSINFYRQQLADDQSHDISIHNSTDNNTGTIIPFFTTTDEASPPGQYWPSSQKIAPGPDGQIINNASAYINNKAYSDVTESKILLPNRQSDYLGYFIDAASKETIYLYGTKDLIVCDNDTIINDSDDSQDN